MILGLLLVGCPYHVDLTASPTAAEVILPSGEIVTTPARVRLRWVPFGHQRVEVRAPDHRTLTVDLHTSEIGLRHEVTFLLVPEHGPVGTWDPEEVP